MNASDARKLSDEKQITIEQAETMIKQCAECGNRQCNIFNYVPEGVVLKLMRDGFKTSYHTNPNDGLETLMISW